MKNLLFAVLLACGECPRVTGLGWELTCMAQNPPLKPPEPWCMLWGGLFRCCCFMQQCCSLGGRWQ